MAVERFLTRAQEATWGAPLPLPGTQDAPGPGAPSALDAPPFGSMPPARGSAFSPTQPLPPGRSLAFGQAQPQLNEAPPPGYFGALRPMGVLGERFQVCEGPGRHAGGAGRARGPGAGAADGLPAGAGAGEAAGAHALRRHGGAAGVRGQGAWWRGARRSRGSGWRWSPSVGRRWRSRRCRPRWWERMPGRLLEALARALPPPGSALDAIPLAEALRVLACHAARHAEGQLSDGKLRALLGELDAADFHPSCIHGTRGGARGAAAGAGAARAAASQSENLTLQGPLLRCATCL